MLSKSGKTMPKKSVRLNLTLTQQAKKRLETIQKVTEADTLTEVIRDAIKLYDLAVQHQKSGGRLILKTEDGEKDILFL